MSTPAFKKARGTEKQKSISLRLPKELWEKIENAKWIHKKSVNQLIVEALEKADWK